MKSALPKPFNPPLGLQVAVFKASALAFVQAAKKEDTNANEDIFFDKED